MTPPPTPLGPPLTTQVKVYVTLMDNSISGPVECAVDWTPTSVVLRLTPTSGAWQSFWARPLMLLVAVAVVVNSN